MSLQSLLNPITITEDWSKLYANEINCENLNANNNTFIDLTVSNNANVGNDLFVLHNAEIGNTLQLSNTVSAGIPPVGFCKVWGGQSTVSIWPNPNIYRIGGGPIEVATNTKLYTNHFYNDNPNFTPFLAGINWVSITGPVGGLSQSIFNSPAFGVWSTIGTAVRLNASLTRSVIVSITANFDALIQGATARVRRFSLWIGNPVAIQNSSIVIENVDVTSRSLSVQCIALLPSGSNYDIQLRVENNDANTAGVQVTNLSYNIIEI